MFSTQQYFGFDPRTIPGCQLWFDGLDPNGNGTLPANNAALSTWVDKSGAGNSGTASGTTPLYQSSGGVLFSAGAYVTNYSASLSSESMFFVYNPTSVPTTITLAGPNGNGGRTITVNTNRRLESSSYFVGFGSVTPDGTVTLNQNCQSGYVNTANSMIVTHNGTTYSPVTLSYTGGLTTRIGASGSTLTIFFQGIIREVLAYNVALTASQRQQVEGYLAWKWGLNTSLPTGQPYKSFPNFQRIPTPLDFGPMLFWWDAADYGTFTPANPTTGTSITGWRDKINSLTLSNVNSSPTWSSNGVVFTNSSSTVSASTQNLVYSNVSSPYTTGQNFTIIVAHSPNLFTGFRCAFYMVAPLAFNTNPSFFAAVQPGASEGNGVGAYNGSSAWYQLQQAAASNTGAGNRRVDTILSAPSNFIWTNGTENTYSINNIARGTTVSGTATITAIAMSTTSTIQGNRAYDGTIHEVLVYSSNLSSNAIRQVEGYLAWKWNVRPNLVSTHPFFNIPTSYPLFTPTSLSNCNLWLDALDTSTFTPANPADGTGITAWSDKSGSNFTFSRTYGSTNATYSAASNSLFFSTSNAGYSSSHSASVTNETLFMVFTPTFSGGSYVVGATGSGGREAGMYINWTRFGNINAQTEWAAITANGSMTGGARNLGISTVSSSSNLAVAVNGGSFVTYTLANPLGSNARTSTLGVEGTTPTYSGHIHEIIAYTRVLSTSERQAVEGYLAWKWGIRNNFATTHPYYKFRP